MSSKEQIDSKANGVASLYSQLRAEFLHNDQLALIILGATLTLAGTAMNVASSTNNKLIYLLAALVLLVGLIGSLDRNLNTFRTASYMRIFLEPELEGMKWENDLGEFRYDSIISRFAGFGLFASFQTLLYLGLIGFNLHLYGYSLIGAAAITLAPLLFAAWFLWTNVFNYRRTFDPIWIRIKYRDLVAELNGRMNLLKKDIKSQPAGQLKHPYLCPGGPYLEQWDWDGFFMGVALAYSPTGTVLTEDTLFLKYWCLNFINSSRDDGYTPGLITPGGPDPRLKFMKPFLAQGAYFASRFLNDSDWLTSNKDENFEKVKLMVGYREKHLWNSQYNLGVWYDSLDSGADNNVVFPTAKEATHRVIGADLNTFIYREHLAMSRLAEKLGKTKDAREYSEKARAIRTAINEYLWSDEDETYWSLDAGDGSRKPIPIKRITYSNFVPLWAKVAPQSKGRRQIKRYLLNPTKMWGAYGIRTLAADDPEYNNDNIVKPHSNWRGPVWPIANYLYMHALLNYGFKYEAISVASKMIDLCLRDLRALPDSKGMHENYDADTGKPLAAEGFVSWNLLVPQMLEQAFAGRNPLDLK